MSNPYITTDGYFVNGADDRLSRLPERNENDGEEEEDDYPRPPCPDDCRQCTRFQSGLCEGEE